MISEDQEDGGTDPVSRHEDNRSGNPRGDSVIFPERKSNLDHLGRTRKPDLLQRLLAETDRLAGTGSPRTELVPLFVPPEEYPPGLFVSQLADRALPVHHQNNILTRSGELRLVSWNNTMLYIRPPNLPARRV